MCADAIMHLTFIGQLIWYAILRKISAASREKLEKSENHLVSLWKPLISGQEAFKMMTSTPHWLLQQKVFNPCCSHMWVVILLKWTVDIYFVKWPLRVHCSHLVFPTISSFRVRRRFVNQFLHSVPQHNLSSSGSGNYKTLHQPNIHHHSHLPKRIYWSGWPFSRVVVALRLVNQELRKHLGQTIVLGQTFLGET